MNLSVSFTDGEKHCCTRRGKLIGLLRTAGRSISPIMYLQAHHIDLGDFSDKFSKPGIMAHWHPDDSA